MSVYSSEHVLDHINDTNGAELNRLSLVYEFPDFVKKASSDDLYPDELHTSTLAFPQAKLYPCHNPASTWLSALYFTEKSAEFNSKDRPRIQERLNYFVNYWGMKAAVDSMQARHAELHKNSDDQLPDNAFALIFTGDNGVKTRHLRMISAAEVKSAAEYIHTHRVSIPYADRNIIATKITEKAAFYGAGLGNLERFIEKQAGHGIPGDIKNIVDMIRQRSMLTKNAKEQAEIASLADNLTKLPRYAFEPGMLVKLATTIDMVDRQLNLQGKYTETILPPEDVIFAVTYNEVRASVDNAVSLTTGRIYEKASFKKIALSDVQSLFGSDFAKEVADGLDVDVEKLAELAGTLPDGDARSFEQLLSESGVKPIYHKAASDRFGLKDEDLESLAMGY